MTNSPDHSRATLWAALIGGIFTIVGALIGVSFGHSKADQKIESLQQEVRTREQSVGTLQEELAKRDVLIRNLSTKIEEQQHLAQQFRQELSAMRGETAESTPLGVRAGSVDDLSRAGEESKKDSDRKVSAELSSDQRKNRWQDEAQDLKFLRLQIRDVKRPRGTTVVTVGFSNIDSERTIGACVIDPNASPLMPAFPGFQPPNNFSLTRDGDAECRDPEIKGIGFCRNEKDWLLLSPKEAVSVVFSFSCSAAARAGDSSTLTGDLRLAWREIGSTGGDPSTGVFSVILPGI